MAAKPILARATAHLPDGIAPGGIYWVDPSIPYIEDCLLARLLVPVEEEPKSEELRGPDRE